MWTLDNQDALSHLGYACVYRRQHYDWQFIQGDRKMTGLPTEIPGLVSDAARWALVTLLIAIAIAIATTNNDTTYTGPKSLTKNRYVD